MNTQKNKVSILLLLIVLLPALFYSVFEISTLNTTEAMIGKMYDRQLNGILFSVNQYSIDAASSWATWIEGNYSRRQFDEFFSNHKAVRGIVIADSGYRHEETYAPANPARATSYFQGLRSKDRETIEQLFQYRQVSYRKLEPVVFHAGGDSSIAALVFVPASGSGIAAIMLDTREFINTVIRKKLTEASEGEFILAVLDSAKHGILFSTSPVTAGAIEQQHPLWIFPAYTLGIRLRGETVGDLARARYTRNLILILLLDCILIAGAWIVYRTVNREMELIAMKSDFVSNVSHELRTPLALIRMFAETLELKRVKTEEKKQEYYRIILQETERLTRLINNILNFSRIEQHAMRYTLRPVQVNDIVRSVLDVYTYQFTEHAFHVTADLSPALPLINADEEALAETLHNLIDNAMKFCSDKKYLRIATRQDHAHVVIEVEDHGIGIAPEHQQKIFEKFFRVSHGLVHTAKGSGLGLALVKHIVAEHKGTICVKSDPGNGSTFILSFPMQRTNQG